MELITAIDIEFEVELILNHSRPLRNIVVRWLDFPAIDFGLTSDSTIGNCAIEALDIPPRILDKNGYPRLDLLNFRLRNRSECLQFQCGQKVLVKNIRIKNLPLLTEFYSSFHVFRPHADICISFFLCAFSARRYANAPTLRERLRRMREISKCGSFT
ncbi:MAG: hypothetical protein RMY34_29015 [Aulosira sp. DedQUE10]|nr:hypothetical protein [Aulosira sp. DedQUE10]